MTQPLLLDLTCGRCDRSLTLSWDPSSGRVLLDLFCGGGGAAMGYARAGYRVIGIDHLPQPHYPFEFRLGDALEAGARLLATVAVDAIHASPPCQVFTMKPAGWGRHRAHWLDHHDLIEPTRQLLAASGLPYVIENVKGAPIRHDLMLCGTMFGLRIRKHRYFESNVLLAPPPRGCTSHAECYDPWEGEGRTAELMRDAMGIDWLPMAGGASRKAGYTGDLYNAIPPAYTEWIGHQVATAPDPAVARPTLWA